MQGYIQGLHTSLSPLKPVAPCALLNPVHNNNNECAFQHELGSKMDENSCFCCCSERQVTPSQHVHSQGTACSVMMRIALACLHNNNRQLTCMPANAGYPNFVPWGPPLAPPFICIHDWKEMFCVFRMFSATSVQHFLSSFCPCVYCGFLFSVCMEPMYAMWCTFQQALPLPRWNNSHGIRSKTIVFHLLLFQGRRKIQQDSSAVFCSLLVCILGGRDNSGILLNATCQLTSRLATVDSLFQLLLDSVG